MNMFNIPQALKLPFSAFWRQCADAGLNTLSQVAVLECIGGSLCQSQIAEQTKLTHSAVSQICGVLELYGLITNKRCDQNRRAVVLELTGDGRSLLSGLSSFSAGACDNTIPPARQASRCRPSPQQS